MKNDPVNHPEHYCSHPSGIEAITITEHMSFNIGNAMKYLWRSGQKDSTTQDLRKAIWYINREISRLEQEGWLKPTRCPVCGQTDCLLKDKYAPV